jgi:cellulose biosynthesis protein BcsQ
MLEHLDLHNIPINLSQVFQDDAHIKDVIYKHVSGIRLIPSNVHSSSMIEQDYNKLGYHYQDLLGDYDYIILDTPSQAPYLETVLKNADEALIIHTPSYSSKNVMDAMNLLNRLKVLNLGIVLNNFSEDGADEIFDHPILEKIPTHNDITKSYKHKNPLLHTYPKSKIAPKFHRLAKRFE